MANTVNNTVNKVAGLIEDILGTSYNSGRSHYGPGTINNGQTCLEKRGMEARAEHIMRNDWRKNDLEYTRALVLAEYAIQNEFKVGSSEEPVVRNRGGLETLAEQYARREDSIRENEKYRADRKAKKEAKEKFLSDPNHTLDDWKEKERQDKQNEKEAKKAKKLQNKIDKAQQKVTEAERRLEQYNEKTKKKKQQ